MIINGFEIGRQELSIALMILFAMALMFFMGYKLAYNKAVIYANDQIITQVEDFKSSYGLTKDNPDYILGNIQLPDMEVLENDR